MKKIIIVLFIFSFIGGYFYASNYFYEKGNKYFEEDKYDLAIKEYEKSVKLMPNQNMIYYYLSKSYFENENYDNTIKFTTKFINKNIYLEDKINIDIVDQNNVENTTEEINGNYILKTFLLDSYKNRGYSYFSKNEYEKSIEDYKKAILINENIKTSYKEIYDFYSKNKNLKKAISIKSKINDIDGNISETYIYLGMMYLGNKNYDLAKNIFLDSLKFDKNNYETYLGIGYINYLDKNYEKAIEDFSTSIKLYNLAEIKKDNDIKNKIEGYLYVSYENLAYIYFNKNEYEKSLSYINKFLIKESENKDILFIRGVIYYEKQDYKKALNDFEELSKYNSSRNYRENFKTYKLNSYYELASNYIKNNDYENALVYVKKYLEIDPSNYDMLRAKSWISVKNGDNTLNTYSINSSDIGSITIPSLPISNSNTYYVNGYYREDGTYVNGHYKTKPNDTKLDNLSCINGGRCGIVKNTGLPKLEITPTKITPLFNTKNSYGNLFDVIE